MKKKKIIILVVLLIFLLIVCSEFSLFLIRNLSSRQLDDLTPGIPCEQSLIDKSDVLFVIPLFENKSIADNRTWCNWVLSLNKTLEMHGVYHTYHEFLTDRDEKYLDLGISAFEKCFGFKPKVFKPSQMAISESNIKLVENRMMLSSKINQLMHKAYHCNDSGKFSNRFVDLV